MPRRPCVTEFPSGRYSLRAGRQPLEEAEIRLLFVFDFEWEAVILVGGDKAGSWNKWYDTAIPLAERRYDEWIADKASDEKGK